MPKKSFNMPTNVSTNVTEANNWIMYTMYITSTALLPWLPHHQLHPIFQTTTACISLYIYICISSILALSISPPPVNNAHLLSSQFFAKFLFLSTQTTYFPENANQASHHTASLASHSRWRGGTFLTEVVRCNPPQPAVSLTSTIIDCHDDFWSKMFYR